MLFNFPVEEDQFPLQGRLPVLRQRLNEIFDHCPQSPDNLHVLRPAVAYFSEHEMHKILPIGSPENNAQLARFIQYFISTLNSWCQPCEATDAAGQLQLQQSWDR